MVDEKLKKAAIKEGKSTYLACGTFWTVSATIGAIAAPQGPSHRILDHPPHLGSSFAFRPIRQSQRMTLDVITSVCSAAVPGTGSASHTLQQQHNCTHCMHTDSGSACNTQVQIM